MIYISRIINLKFEAKINKITIKKNMIYHNFIKTLSNKIKAINNKIYKNLLVIYNQLIQII